MPVGVSIVPRPRQFHFHRGSSLWLGRSRRCLQWGIKWTSLICCVLCGRKISIPTAPGVCLTSTREKYPHIIFFLIWTCSFRSYACLTCAQLRVFMAFFHAEKVTVRDAKCFVSASAEIANLRILYCSPLCISVF